VKPEIWPTGSVVRSRSGSSSARYHVGSGGAGNDFADYFYASSAVIGDLGDNAVTVAADDQDVLDAIENRAGSSYNDTLTGSVLDKTLVGGYGHDFPFWRRGQRPVRRWRW